MKRLDTYIQKLSKKVNVLHVQLESPNQNISYTYQKDLKKDIFHSASIGKLFCATLVMMAIDEKHIKLETKVYDILKKGMLDMLYIYKNIDYQKDVTVEMLLSHTSGVNDYFEGKTINHQPFIKMVLSNKDHLFTKEELLDFTRFHQQAVSKPGDKFLYSDTGYILLGEMLESIYQMPYEQILKTKIFNPLHMPHTKLCFYDPSFDQKDLAPLYFNGIEMSQAKSLSCDYAGGGLQTTTKDLSVFMNALFNGTLIPNDLLYKMMDVKHSFHGIMRYGLGMIEVLFHRLAPWLRGYPKLYGGLGSLSVFAFYDPKEKDTYIINLGDSRKMRIGFLLLIQMASTLKKIRKGKRHGSRN